MPISNITINSLNLQTCIRTYSMRQACYIISKSMILLDLDGWSGFCGIYSPYNIYIYIYIYIYTPYWPKKGLPCAKQLLCRRSALPSPRRTSPVRKCSHVVAPTLMWTGSSRPSCNKYISTLIHSITYRPLCG